MFDVVMSLMTNRPTKCAAKISRQDQEGQTNLDPHPTALHTNGAKEMMLRHWKEIRDKHGGIKQTLVEPYSPWQNRAEAEVREIKKEVTQIMSRMGAHKHSWDFCLEYVSKLCSRTALGLPVLNGRTPYEMVTGDTPDI